VIPNAQTTSDCVIAQVARRGNSRGLWIAASRNPRNDDDFLVFSKLLTTE
jgi:hypothetical protein